MKLIQKLLIIAIAFCSLQTVIVANGNNDNALKEELRKLDRKIETFHLQYETSEQLLASGRMPEFVKLMGDKLVVQDKLNKLRGKRPLQEISGNTPKKNISQVKK